MTVFRSSRNESIRILNPSLPERLGGIQHVLFDFDGTLSTLRQGWEDVMAPMMLEMVSPNRPPSETIENDVRQYIDRSTGILTIRQMEWLVEAVQRYRLSPTVLTAQEYKAIYIARILEKVQQRVTLMELGQSKPEDHLVAGVEKFIQELMDRQVILYLASGTDHEDVVNEAGILGLVGYFAGGIYGALDSSEAHDKGRLIQRILAENDLSGDQLLVVGDGPVEIRVAVDHGAIALGVASDEVRRSGWAERKVSRLTQAGADLLIPDFTDWEPLITLLFPAQV